MRTSPAGLATPTGLEQHTTRISHPVSSSAATAAVGNADGAPVSQQPQTQSSGELQAVAAAADNSTSSISNKTAPSAIRPNASVTFLEPASTTDSASRGGYTASTAATGEALAAAQTPASAGSQAVSHAPAGLVAASGNTGIGTTSAANASTSTPALSATWAPSSRRTTMFTSSFSGRDRKDATTAAADSSSQPVPALSSTWAPSGSRHNSTADLQRLGDATRVSLVGGRNSQAGTSNSGPGGAAGGERFTRTSSSHSQHSMSLEQSPSRPSSANGNNNTSSPGSLGVDRLPPSRFPQFTQFNAVASHDTLAGADNGAADAGSSGASWHAGSTAVGPLVAVNAASGAAQPVSSSVQSSVGDGAHTSGASPSRRPPGLNIPGGDSTTAASGTDSTSQAVPSHTAAGGAHTQPASRRTSVANALEAPHVFARFEVPATLYATQEDILNDKDIHDLLHKVAKCCGLMSPQGKVHWHLGTASARSSDTADGPGPTPRHITSMGVAFGVTDNTWEAGGQQAASTDADVTHPAEIHVHVDKDCDGRLSVVISDTDYDEPAPAISVSAVRPSEQSNKDFYYQSSSNRSAHVFGSIIGGMPVPFSVGPDAGSSMTVTASTDSSQQHQAAQQQTVGSQKPIGAVVQTDATSQPIAAPRFMSSMAARRSTVDRRSSVDRFGSMISVAPAPGFATAAPNKPWSLSSGTLTQSNQGPQVTNMSPQLHANDDAMSMCDTVSDISALANPLAYADKLKARLEHHVTAPPADNPPITPRGAASQLDRYLDDHTALKRKAGEGMHRLDHSAQASMVIYHGCF